MFTIFSSNLARDTPPSFPSIVYIYIIQTSFPLSVYLTLPPPWHVIGPNFSFQSNVSGYRSKRIAKVATWQLGNLFLTVAPAARRQCRWRIIGLWGIEVSLRSTTTSLKWRKKRSRGRWDNKVGLEISMANKDSQGILKMSLGVLTVLLAVCGTGRAQGDQFLFFIAEWVNFLFPCLFLWFLYQWKKIFSSSDWWTHALGAVYDNMK